ncbi:hypothetical protein GCM10027200_78050 [Lentzea nigeriaca]
MNPRTFPAPSVPWNGSPVTLISESGAGLATGSHQGVLAAAGVSADKTNEAARARRSNTSAPLRRCEGAHIMPWNVAVSYSRS